jgi:DNA-directed RNA polymerase subunit H (RpoH/RPB5)
MVLFQDKITALPKDSSIEVKPMSALYINPPQHRLVPRHRLLEPAEEKALLERLMCVREKLPVIFVTDPVVRYYDFPLNRIIEIERPSPYYRCIRAGVAKGNYDKFFVK